MLFCPSTCDYNNPMTWVKRSFFSSQNLTGHLRKLERRIETLVEGSAARLFPTSQTRHELALRLVEAMQQGIQTGPAGESICPNLFVLQASPQQAAGLAGDPGLLDALIQTLYEEGEEAGWHFAGQLAIRVSEVADLPAGELRVQAYHSQAGLPSTTAVETQRSVNPPAALPSNAFFIVDGVQVVTLRQAVINIGRRADNHLVIDDIRISRVHAQLRAAHGQYVIFDLDSAGGTWVNGERVNQRALQPGDVVSLSGVPLVYGQDAETSNDTLKMQPG